MKKIRTVSLYSGSSGNSTLIEYGDTKILIDAGKNNKCLTNALGKAGVCANEINAVFVTHEHTDHISALEVFVKKVDAPVHITSMSAYALRLPQSSALFQHLAVHSPLFEEKVGGLTVKSFGLSHDSALCVGYKITADNGYSIGIATDTGYVTEGMKQALFGCDAVILESNHDLDMLKTGPYPAELKRRIASKFGHLSNADCAAFAETLAEGGTKEFMLAHISRENNTPDIALETVGNAIKKYGASLSVAKQDAETLFCGND